MRCSSSGEQEFILEERGYIVSANWCIPFSLLIQIFAVSIKSGGGPLVTVNFQYFP